MLSSTGVRVRTDSQENLRNRMGVVFRGWRLLLDFLGLNVHSSIPADPKEVNTRSLEMLRKVVEALW